MLIKLLSLLYVIAFIYAILLLKLYFDSQLTIIYKSKVWHWCSLFFVRLVALILFCRRKFQKKRSRSSTLPSVLMSRILESNSQSDDEDEDNEINENEKPTESFPSTKENPYQDDDEHIYEYAQSFT